MFKLQLVMEANRVVLKGHASLEKETATGIRIVQATWSVEQTTAMELSLVPEMIAVAIHVMVDQHVVQRTIHVE